jgi:hypothetical protein
LEFSAAKIGILRRRIWYFLASFRLVLMIYRRGEGPFSVTLTGAISILSRDTAKYDLCDGGVVPLLEAGPIAPAL